MRTRVSGRNEPQDKAALVLGHPRPITRKVPLGSGKVGPKGLSSLGVRVPRPPPPSSQGVSAVMRANRPTSTGPEVSLRRALRALGIRGFRVGYRAAPGRPDIAFPRRSLAIFVNGCFWHRCPRHGRKLPFANRDYWKLKFHLNVIRDRRKRQQLRALGWRVVTFWECEIEEDVTGAARRIADCLRASGFETITTPI
jgi:DNA mismatch endonuclease (patch repair protein)